MTEPLTPIEIEEGWIAEPCGCAYHPGSNTPRHLGAGMTVVGEGFMRRTCQTHLDEIERQRAALRYRLFEAPDTPAPSRLERWLANRDTP